MKKILFVFLAFSFLYSCSDIDRSIPPDVVKTDEIRISIGRKIPSLDAARPNLPSPNPPFTAQDLYIGVQFGTAAISGVNGNGYYYNRDQPNNIAMASTGGSVYSIITGDTYSTGNPNLISTLYRLNPTTGGYTNLGAQWGSQWNATKTDDMTAWNGWLYAIQGGTLWRVNPSNGAKSQFSQYPTGWEGTEAMTALDGFLYAIQGGTLWRVNIGTGAVSSFSQYPDGWQGTEGMAATNGGIFIVQGGTLWRVGTNGTVAPYSQFSTGWQGTLAMTSRNGVVYIIQGTALWSVNTFSQAVAQVGNVDWAGSTAMTARN
jgi:hypothetical protein